MSGPDLHSYHGPYVYPAETAAERERRGDLSSSLFLFLSLSFFLRSSDIKPHMSSASDQRSDLLDIFLLLRTTSSCPLVE